MVCVHLELEFKLHIHSVVYSLNGLLQLLFNMLYSERKVEVSEERERERERVGTVMAGSL